MNKAFPKFQNFSDEPIKVTHYQNNNNNTIIIIIIICTYIYILFYFIFEMHHN
jgi:hypothetical protein